MSSVERFIMQYYPESMPAQPVQIEPEEKQPARVPHKSFIAKLRELSEEPEYELNVTSAAEWVATHPVTEEEKDQELQRHIAFKPMEMGRIAIEFDVEIIESELAERTPEHAA
jgi:hypothetical protein